MRHFARRDIDEGGPMGATVKKGNGTLTKIVDDLKDYRAESPLFSDSVSWESNQRLPGGNYQKMELLMLWLMVIGYS